MSWLVEAICYKPEGREFGSRRDHFHFINLPNPSSFTIALALIQYLAEISTRDLPKWQSAADI
jgi:hypothetical protein